MTLNQVKRIFGDTAPSTEVLKEKFESISTTENYKYFTNNYENMFLDYANELLVCTNEHGQTFYTDFSSIVLVITKRTKFKNALEKDLYDHLLPR